MKQKIISTLLKRIDFPSVAELRFILRKFDFLEKILFVVFLLLLTTSLLGLLWIANAKISIKIPEEGGSISEGIMGTPNLINPLLATSDTDRDMVALIFSGLTRPDGKGGLIPDLADSFEISEDGLSYTFNLNKSAVWHDGKKITSEDIAFTIQAAKNPSLKSPTRANWEGVETEIVDEYTIRFWLKRPYAPFLENTTIGILPKHIWKNISPAQFAFSDFNKKPIGSGPFAVNSFERDSSGLITSYKLKAFKKYVPGKPFIEQMKVKFYPSEKELIDALDSGAVDMISAISPHNIKEIKKNNAIATLTLPRVFAVFFNQNNNAVLAKQEVRAALNKAVDKNQIIKEVLAGYGTALTSPIPPGSFGAITPEENKEYSLEGAKDILRKNGWEINEEKNIWEKETKKESLILSFILTTSDSPDLVKTAQMLKTSWEELGAQVDLKIFETGDLNQNIIRSRDYDAILFGEVVGRDPDPFAFWHSSQRNDPGLNIAMYANITADKLLEEARTTYDREERKEKYIEFQKEVAKDKPAVFLYSPYYLYIIPQWLKGIKVENITVPSERFTGVHQWYIETRNIWKIFAK